MRITRGAGAVLSAFGRAVARPTLSPANHPVPGLTRRGCATRHRWSGAWTVAPFPARREWERDCDMHESLLISTCLTARNRVPQVPKDLGHPASQDAGPHLHWLARLLAYVCTAFLVACANASLVTTLSIARLTFPACPSLATSPNAVGRLASQVVLAIQSWTLRQAYPRAPPIPVAAVSQFMAPDAHALLCHDCKFSKGARVCPSSF